MSFKAFKTALACTLSAAMLLGAAACGTTDEATSGSGSSSSSSTAGYDVSGIKKDASIAAMLPDSVTKDGKLTVGMELTYAPAEFLKEDGKTPVGYDVDLSKALGKVFGLDTQIVSASFDSIIPSVGSKYDLGITSLTITKERMDAVNFVSYYKAGATWVVKKGNPQKVDTSDLCGMKIAVQTGTVEEEDANKAAKQCKTDGKKAIEVLSSKLQTDAATNVVTGKADVFYADSPVAGYAISQTDGQLQALGKDEGSVKQGIAIAKDDDQTAKAVQKAVQKLMDDGTYMKILKHWGVQSGALSEAEINPAELS